MYDDRLPQNSSVPFRLEIRTPFGTTRGAAPRVVFDRPTLQIVEEPFLHLTSLRLSRKADIAQFIDTSSVELAQAPNSYVGSAAQSAARFEPRAWLLIGQHAPLPITASDCVVTDLSARLTSFRLQGVAAERTLRAATGVIPGEQGFVRTLFAETYSVLLQRLGEHEFRMLVDVSFAPSFADWLGDAASLALAGAV